MSMYCLSSVLARDSIVEDNHDTCSHTLHLHNTYAYTHTSSPWIGKCAPTRVFFIKNPAHLTHPSHNTHAQTWDDSAPPQLNATDVEATVAQLLGDVEYCFRVRARSDVGPGNYSDESCNTTLAPTKPDAPAAVVPLNSSDISLQVAMLAGAGNGRPIDVMVVETSEVAPSSIGRRRGAAPRAWSFGCSVTPPCPWGCNCTVTGLKADTVYDVRCSANNSIGESPYVDSVPFQQFYTLFSFTVG